MCLCYSSDTPTVILRSDTGRSWACRDLDGLQGYVPCWASQALVYKCKMTPAVGQHCTVFSISSCVVTVMSHYWTRWPPPLLPRPPLVFSLCIEYVVFVVLQIFGNNKERRKKRRWERIVWFLAMEGDWSVCLRPHLHLTWLCMLTDTDFHCGWWHITRLKVK